MIMDGFITNVTQTISDKGKMIQITGKNVLEFLFSTPIFIDTEEDGALTAPYIIKKVIDEVNRLNGDTGDFQIRYTGPGSSSSDTITTLLSNGSTISKTHSNVQSYWKKSHLIIEDYSKTEMTGDSVPHMAM